MSVDSIICHLVANRSYNKAKMQPRAIVLHSTAANNPYIWRYVNPASGQVFGLSGTESEVLAIIGKNSNGNHWNRKDADVSVHAVIGKLKDGTLAACNTLPYDNQCWGCGGAANGYAIQFEICEDDHSSADYCRQTYELAAKYCAELMVRFPTIKIENIMSHKEAGKRGLGSGHTDPDNWWPKFGLTMNGFRARVQEIYNSIIKGDEDMTKEDVQEIVKETMTKNSILSACGDKWIETFEDLPEWAKPEVRELIELGAIKGTVAGVPTDETVIRATLNGYIRPVIIAWRMGKASAELRLDDAVTDDIIRQKLAEALSSIAESMF